MDLSELFPVQAYGDLRVVQSRGAKLYALRSAINAIPQNEIIYASSPYGAGHITLAAACKDAGKKLTIVFPPKDDKQVEALFNSSAENGVRDGEGVHYMFNGRPLVCSYLVAQQSSDTFIMPFGFEFPEFYDALVDVYRDGLPKDASEFWMCMGTGVSVRALCDAFPDKQINAVSVNAPDEGSHGRAVVSRTRLDISTPLSPSLMPPFESSPHFDAKVWPYFENLAKDGAVFINHGPRVL